MDRYYEYTDRLNTPIEAFTHITYDYNFPILPHWHYFIECIYLTAGNLLVTCDENVYSLQPNGIKLRLIMREVGIFFRY